MATSRDGCGSAADGNRFWQPRDEQSCKLSYNSFQSTMLEPSKLGDIPEKPARRHVYSKSDLDILGVLTKVTNRPHPQVQIGAVDTSCAFVVCDACLQDSPIVYVSDGFEYLTGYNRHDIIGQNCRFLQAPDGNVAAGTQREFVENAKVGYLKEKIQQRKEIQETLINYRKGGQPFVNLLTIIPIRWDSEVIRYFVGFQVNVAELSNGAMESISIRLPMHCDRNDITGGTSVIRKPNDGGLETKGIMPAGPVRTTTTLSQLPIEHLQLDETSQIWSQLLLDHADDIVQVLSLKGRILFSSPSCKTLLGFDVAELLGTALPSLCHPADVVSVGRALHKAAAKTPLDVIFRVKRKYGGYIWLEGFVSLMKRNQKSKSLILVGRERPLFALSRRVMESDGGSIGDTELWTKISISGLILFISSTSRVLLGQEPSALVGKSMQDLLKLAPRSEFTKSVQQARTGKPACLEHKISIPGGQFAQARTILYPGELQGNQSPTFLLARTVLLKDELSAKKTASLAGDTPTVAPKIAADETASELYKPSSGDEASATQSVPKPATSKCAVLIPDDNFFNELETNRITNWQYEVRHLEKMNKLLSSELETLLSRNRKRA